MGASGGKTSLCPGPAFVPTTSNQNSGAGEGNRTLVVSLEGFCSTIELHPPDSGLCPRDCLNSPITHTKNYPYEEFCPPPSPAAHPCSCSYFWWRGKDSNLRRQSRQIYSLIPLTAREPLRTKPRIIDKNRRPVKPRPGSEVFHAASTLKPQWVTCRFRGIGTGPATSVPGGAFSRGGAAHPLQ